MAFKAGKSGNPLGRPKGSRDKRTELRAMLEMHASDLVKKAVEMALDGDVVALKICLERIIPSLRATDIDQDVSSVPLRFVLKMGKELEQKKF